jgi:hypothetical protein
LKNSATFSHHQPSKRTFPITSSLPHFTQNFFFLFPSFHCVTEITEIAPKKTNQPDSKKTSREKEKSEEMETKFVLLEIRRRETTSFFAPGTQGSHNANDFYVKHNILPHTQQHTEESGTKKKKGSTIGYGEKIHSPPRHLISPS